MKRICLLALVVGTWPGLGIAQTTEELVNDGQNSDNVLTQSLGYDRKSDSPLSQVDGKTCNGSCPFGTRV